MKIIIILNSLKNYNNKIFHRKTVVIKLIIAFGSVPTTEYAWIASSNVKPAATTKSIAKLESF